MTISPLSAVTSLVTQIRPGATEDAPTSIAPRNGGNASQSPTGAEQPQGSGAVVAVAAMPPPEALLPDPGPFVIAPSDPSPVSAPPVAPVAQTGTASSNRGAEQPSAQKSSAGGSTIVLKPNEIPPSEDMQALIEARKRAEMFKDSLAMKQLIASLEMAVATELPKRAVRNKDEVAVTEPEKADATDPKTFGSAPSMNAEKPDAKVDLRY